MAIRQDKDQLKYSQGEPTVLIKGAWGLRKTISPANKEIQLIRTTHSGVREPSESWYQVIQSKVLLLLLICGSKIVKIPFLTKLSRTNTLKLLISCSHSITQRGHYYLNGKKYNYVESRKKMKCGLFNFFFFLRL